MIPLGIVASAHKASATFTPASLPNLAGWWDSDDATTFSYSSGSVVSQWRDKSGLDRHFAQATVANQPSRNGTQNGRTTVVFDGSTDYLDTSPFTLPQPLTLIYAGFLGGPGSTWGILSSVGGNLQTYWGDNALKYYAGTNEVEATIRGWSGGARTVAFNFNGSSSASWIDGTAGFTGNPGSSGTNGLRTAERNLANRFNGSLYEIIVCSSVLTTTDRQAAEAYLKTKWGTP